MPGPSGDHPGTGPEVLLHGMHAVEQPIPARIGSADGRPLGQQPAGEQVGDRGHTVGGRDLDADQTVEEVLGLPVPEAEGPGVHRRHAPALGREDRGAVTRRKAEIAIRGRRHRTAASAWLLETPTVQRSAGPLGTLGERPVHQEPGVRAGLNRAARGRARAARERGRAPGSRA